MLRNMRSVCLSDPAYLCICLAGYSFSCGCLIQVGKTGKEVGRYKLVERIEEAAVPPVGELFVEKSYSFEKGSTKFSY